MPRGGSRFKKYKNLGGSRGGSRSGFRSRSSSRSASPA